MLSVRCKNKKLLPEADFIRLLQLRHKVFKRRLNWDVECNNQLESDEYDTDNTQYMYVKTASDEIIGCWRILPTSGKYMLKDTFSQCLDGESAPVSEKIYELSRFAVDKVANHSSHFSPSEVTMEMFRAIYKFAVYNDITHYVTVTSIGVEKLLKRIGLPHQRMGDRQVHKLGDTRSVALLIPIDEQFRASVGLNIINVKQSFVFETDTQLDFAA